MHRADRHIPPVGPPATDSPGLPRWRRILSKVCLSGILLISVALTLDAIGTVRLRAAMHAARAGGEPLTYEEILARRTAAPEDLDAAPVFLELQPRLAELIHDRAFERLSFRRWGSRRALLGYRWPDEDRQAVAEALEQYKPELDRLDSLRSLSGGNLPLAVTEKMISTDRRPLWTARQPLWEVRLAARLCSLRALQAAEEGDSKLLLKSTATILSLSRLVCTHPSSTGAMVSCGCDEQAVSTIERACGLGVLPAEVLAAWEGALAEADRREPLYWGLLGERASFFDVGQIMLKTGQSPVPTVPATGRVPGMRGLLMMDLAAGMGFHNRLMAEARDPAACLKLIDEFERQDSTLPRVYWLTQALLPRPSRLCHFALRRLIRLRAARVGLAVERFRLDKGRFPEQLAELMPEYLRDPPIDPFDGRVLRYRVDAQGAAVYSSAEGMDEGWSERNLAGAQPEMGFILLTPDERGRAAPPPATQPTSSPSDSTL